MSRLNQFVTLEDILGKNAEELTAVATGEFKTEKLGTIPFTAIDHAEYKQAKKDSIKMLRNGTGGMEPDLDEDKMMGRVVIRAVHKDKRSNFTFESKSLLEKLTEANAKEGKPPVTTADEALSMLLAPGEIIQFAMAVQAASGFGPQAQKEVQEDVKNS